MDEYKFPTFEQRFEASVDLLFRYFILKEPTSSREDFIRRFIEPLSQSDGQLLNQTLKELQGGKEAYASGKPILRMTGVDGQHTGAGYALP